MRADQAEYAERSMPSPASCWLGLVRAHSSKLLRAHCILCCDGCGTCRGRSSGSWALCCRAVAGIVGPSRRNINESLASNRLAAWPVTSDGPPASPSAPNSGKGSCEPRQYTHTGPSAVLRGTGASSPLSRARCCTDRASASIALVLPRVARHAAAFRSASSARNASGLRP